MTSNRVVDVGREGPLGCTSGVASDPDAGVRRRFATHQLWYAHAVGLAREGVVMGQRSAPERVIGDSASERTRRLLARLGPGLTALARGPDGA